jgi:hypothetical protein
MKKLTRIQQKNIIGGDYPISECSVRCSDGLMHSVNCGTYACETTTNGTVNCTSGTTVMSNTDPCKVPE